MSAAPDQTRQRSPDVHVLSVNAAALGLVSELLWLPGAAAAAGAVELLYGRDVRVPDAFLAQVGRGGQPPCASLLAADLPLVSLLPSRLGPASAWREGAQALKAARGLARARYRELQVAFVAGASRAAPEAEGTLVRYTYGTRGHWFWSDCARRILDRVSALNRAMLSLLSAMERGEAVLPVGALGAPLPPRSYDLPAAVLDALAEALPPVASPDFERFTAALAPTGVVLTGDESIERYQSLFAEMLGLAGHPEVPR